MWGEWKEKWKKEERERNGDRGELALPRSLHSEDEAVEMFVDSLSKPACSPRSVSGTGVILEVHCQGDMVSPLTPRGVFYPFQSRVSAHSHLPPLWLLHENLASMKTWSPDYNGPAEKWVTDDG